VLNVRAVGHGQATRYSARSDKRAGTAGAPSTALAALALAALALALAALAAGWASRQLERTEVAGDSMRPALQPGDRLLVRRTKSLKVGDIVAAADPRRPARTVLKRAAAVDDSGVFLVGDNDARSTDSRHFGLVPLSLVRGKAVYRYAPSGRAGRI
jgi:nickel-type superoxide dismutase maturation protease